MGGGVFVDVVGVGTCNDNFIIRKVAELLNVRMLKDCVAIKGDLGIKGDDVA